MLRKPLEEGPVHRGEELVNFGYPGIQGLQLRPYVQKLIVPFARLPVLLELPFLRKCFNMGFLRPRRCLQPPLFPGKAGKLCLSRPDLRSKRRKMGRQRQLLILGRHPLLQVRNQALLRRYPLPEGLFNAGEPRLKRFGKLSQLLIQRLPYLHLPPLPGRPPGLEAQPQFPLAVLVFGRDIGILPREPLPERLGRFQRRMQRRLLPVLFYKFLDTKPFVFLPELRNPL